MWKRVLEAQDNTGSVVTIKKSLQVQVHVSLQDTQKHVIDLCCRILFKMQNPVFLNPVLNFTNLSHLFSIRLVIWIKTLQKKWLD